MTVVERPLTGEALALTDVELVITGGGATDDEEEPLVATDPDFPGDVPEIFLVASFTSWNFSINCRYYKGDYITLITLEREKGGIHDKRRGIYIPY